MTITGSFLIIQDYMTLADGVGSPLFAGSPIYAYCSTSGVSGKNNIGNKPRLMVDLTMDNDDNLKDYWNRRKGYNQYVSAEPLMITCTGTWIEELGSVGTIGSILTPYKLMRMGISGHQLFIRGTRVIDNILNGENETVGSFYDGTKGIPVVIESWSPNANAKTENDVRWNITFREDRED